MPFFRKKPVMIEAVRFDRIAFFEQNRYSIEFDTAADLPKWLRDALIDEDVRPSALRDGCLVVRTLEGEHIALPGDWIVRGVKGELYPCKDEIFAMTYEPVDEQDIEVTGVAI